jgi:superfamily I DNA/RNA helicase
LKFEERFLLEDLKGINNEGIRQLHKRLDALGAAWARLQSDAPGWPTDPKDKIFLVQLSNWLKFHKAMLIAEIVPETLKFVRNNPLSPDVPHFRHVLIDEYQDLNKAEQVLLKELADDGNLMVVGDENQSFYSFKFAHPDGILQFNKENPDAREFPLTQCRRCPKLIVELANELISKNKLPLTQVLETGQEVEKGKVYVVQWKSLEEEAEGLARFIKYAVDSCLAGPGAVLVLAPRRQIGYLIRDRLVELGVSAKSFFYEEALDGDQRNLETSRAQQAFTLLTLLVEPGDRVALRCWCGFGSSSLNSKAWGRLREYCENSGSTPKDALEALETGQLRIPDTDELVKRYRELKTKLSELSQLNSQALLAALFPVDEQWANELRDLVPHDDVSSARVLLDTLRAAITQPELPTDVDCVRVMSLHKAKRLSADLVIVAGCVQGLIPTEPDRNSSPNEQKKMLEEQRWLFYVAITRTRKILVLSSVTRLPKHEAYRMRAKVGPRGKTIASQFLNELGPSLPRADRGTEWLKRLRLTI